MNKLSLVMLSFLFPFFSQAAMATLNDLDIRATDIQALNRIITGKVPHGKFSGETLNTTIRRPLYVIGTGADSSEVLSDKLYNNDSVLVANFYHNSEFYVARIPISKVNSVVLLIAPFSKMASHTMLRFLIDEDARVDLVAKIESNSTNTEVNIKPLETPIAIKDMVFSIDGTEPRGQVGWNMKDAVAGAYTIAHRMVSVQERFRWFVLEGTPINQVDLNISREMAQRLVRRGIEISQTETWSRGYHLLCANCTNLAIRLVKNNISYSERNTDTELRSLKKNIQEKLDPFMRVFEPLTQFTRLNLGILGWLGNNRVDLQNEPKFRSEIMEVAQDLRLSITNNTNYSEAEKAELYKNLGVDEGLPIIANPARFGPALKAYKATVSAAKSKAAVCLQFYAL